MILPFHDEPSITQSAPAAVRHLRAGGLLAYPTETVYGLGCTLKTDSLDRLAALKGGREGKAFILLIREPADVDGLRWNRAAHELAGCFWPGPVTLALAAHDGRFPDAIVGPTGLVAVRVSPHRGVRGLLELLREPLTSTSANLAGQPPARSADDVRLVLEKAGRSDTLILDGGTLPETAPSTLIDCSTPVPQLLRAGAVPIEELRRCVHELRA